MSKIHTEDKEVFGTLETDFGTFNMLSEFPNKMDVPWYLRDMGVLSFFVVDRDGFGKNVLVRGDFLIRPIPEKASMSVSFWIEEENIKVDSLE